MAVRTSANQKRRRDQAGYSLLMVIFIVATMIILASAATLKIDTQGRRERETEMVWRGRQYERAIGMYYRKFGKYPTKVDDLVNQTNGIRFLRKAYKDPMNKEDGSWRFIYVGPNGQLIGSKRQISLLQSVLSTAAPPGGSSPFGVGGMQGPASPGKRHDARNTGRARSAWPDRSVSESSFDARSSGITAAAAARRGDRRKHYRRRQQNERFIAARL
jgi:type II secretory pathway pseudopilin PulG